MRASEDNLVGGGVPLMAFPELCSKSLGHSSGVSVQRRDLPHLVLDSLGDNRSKGGPRLLASLRLLSALSLELISRPQRPASSLSLPGHLPFHK